MAKYNKTRTFLLSLVVQSLEGCLLTRSRHRYECVGLQGVCFCFQWLVCMCQLVEQRRGPSCTCLLPFYVGEILDPVSEEEAAGDSGEGVGREDFTAI